MFIVHMTENSKHQIYFFLKYLCSFWDKSLLPVNFHIYFIYLCLLAPKIWIFYSFNHKCDMSCWYRDREWKNLCPVEGLTTNSLCFSNGFCTLKWSLCAKNSYFISCERKLFIKFKWIIKIPSSIHSGCDL